MKDKQIRTIASLGLFIGAIFGMIGSIVPSPILRGLAWCIDGVGLVLGTSILAVYFLRKGKDILASGFLIFTIGQGFILASGGFDLNANLPVFATGTALWATALALISFQNQCPKLFRVTGILAAILFLFTAIRVFMGEGINALAEPLPFYAYPFFALTLFGWGGTLLRNKYANESTAEPEVG